MKIGAIENLTLGHLSDTTIQRTKENPHVAAAYGLFHCWLCVQVNVLETKPHLALNRPILGSFTPYTVIRFVSLSAKVGICAVVRPVEA